MVKKILGVGILSATLLFGITGCDVKVGKMDYEEYKTGMYVGDMEIIELPEGGVLSKSYGKDIKELDIQLDVGIIEVVESKGKEFQVDIGKEEKIAVKNQGKTLKIYNEESTKIMGGAVGENRKIKVFVPEDSLIDMDLKLGAGIILFNGIKANKVNVVNGMGIVGSGGLVSINKIEVEQGAGGVAFGIREVKDIKINQEVGGNMIVAESITGTMEQKTKMGAIVAQYVQGNPNIKTSLKLGEVTLPEKVNKEGATKIGNINSKNNLGLIQIESISKEQFENFLKDGRMDTGEILNFNVNEAEKGFEFNIG